MKILIENKQKKIKLDLRKVRGRITRLMKHLNCSDKEVSILLVGDEEIQLLNKQYRGKNKPTNVLSFSLLEGECGNVNPQLLGDIVISVDTVQKDARKQDLSLERAMDLLIGHGLLHLLGYNHENTSKKEARKMHQKERELCEFLKDRL